MRCISCTNKFTEELPDRERGIGYVVCKACGPEYTRLKCEICPVDDLAKLALDFPESERKENLKTRRRCWACYICCRCNKKYGSER